MGGIASGEGLVHIEMTQRKDFDQEKKSPDFEVSERLTVTINTFLRMHQQWTGGCPIRRKGVIKNEIMQTRHELNFWRKRSLFSFS